MNDSTLHRLGAASGALSLALGLVALGLGTGTSAANPGAPPQEIARVYASAPTPGVWLGAYLEVLAYLLLFVFVTRLGACLRAFVEGLPTGSRQPRSVPACCRLA
jgi:hypothetical protein